MLDGSREGTRRCFSLFSTVEWLRLFQVAQPCVTLAVQRQAAEGGMHRAAHACVHDSAPPPGILLGGVGEWLWGRFCEDCAPSRYVYFWRSCRKHHIAGGRCSACSAKWEPGAQHQQLCRSKASADSLDDLLMHGLWLQLVSSLTRPEGLHMWRCRLGLLQLELWSATQCRVCGQSHTSQHYSAVLALVQLGPKFIELMFITPIAKRAHCLPQSSKCLQ